MKGCFIQCLSVVTIYSEGNLFVEDLLFWFYSILNASSLLKTSSYPKYFELFENVANFQLYMFWSYYSYSFFNGKNNLLYLKVHSVGSFLQYTIKNLGLICTVVK